MTPLGKAQRIGWTTGTHLHYAVAVDRNTDMDNNDMFAKPYSIPNDPGEWIDTILAIEMHMEPGKGGGD